MKPIQLKVARIGNSRGVRIPAPTLERYRIGDSVVMEELAEGILLRPRRSAGPKLSWDDTARAMAREVEDWSVWDETIADGLDQVPWEPREVKPVAEKRRGYSVAGSAKGRTKGRAKK
jgi:antitoxin component of MazEF toxin-antitoxin module